jgi:hypothetical protein
MSSSLIPGKAKDPRHTVTAFRRHQPGTQPDYLYPAYRATRLRAPSQPLIFLPHTRSEVTGPVFGHSAVNPNDSGGALQHAPEPPAPAVGDLRSACAARVRRCFSMCNHFLRINQDPGRGRP